MAAPKKLTISCGASGIEREVCLSGTAAWSRRSGIPVEIFSTPNESNDRLVLYAQLLAAKSADVDVFQIDIIWPALLARHLLDLSQAVPPDERARFLPRTMEATLVAGKLVALPWFVDAGVLYYRKDLLEKYGRKVPETWEELGETAKRVVAGERAAGNRLLKGYVFQGRAYEGLTCNALEWIASHGGGSLVDSSGRLTVDNRRAVAALDLIASWMGTIVGEGVLTYGEEEARGAFQSGNSVFMRNWPYAWPLVASPESALHDKVGLALLPKGDRGGGHDSTLGGQALAVSAYTAAPKEAIELAKFLTGLEQQKMRALRAGYNPTRTALYDDPELAKKNPHLGLLKAALDESVARPALRVGARYNRLSADFAGAVHDILAGRSGAAQRLSRLERRVDGYANGGAW